MAQQERAFVFLFSELDHVEQRVGRDRDKVRGLLGGKGGNLAEMTRLGIPVPPGFTISTEACNAFLNAGERFPAGMWDEVLEAIHGIEEAVDRRFGDPERPLLVSCRSGARFSMPGMMDTILNIGLNDRVAEALVALTDDARFVYDSYRRLVQMFGSVVLGVPDELFESVITRTRVERGVRDDSALLADDWRAVTKRFREITHSYSGEPFPDEPLEQLRLATEAVFKSWNGKRAFDYREAAHIAHDLGTAVNVQAMVFGNMGADCATGVSMSRNASTGAPEIEGDFLVNAQGEDVVAGIRTTQPIEELAVAMPAMHAELCAAAKRLETHYRNMQDMEFTVERGKLWILQTRDGKRTAQAEVRIAVDMANEQLISREEAVRRVKPDQIDFFLHPQLEADAYREHEPIASGLNVSPGAAVGIAAFDADTAERWSRDGRPVVMIRPETKPDDVHGMLAAQGIVTLKGGRTSHAALVARQFGKPAVVGAEKLTLDMEQRELHVDSTVIREGEWVSIDGTHGRVYEGQLPTAVPDLENPALLQILAWADEFRRLDVRANADYPRDAERARSYGATGIGLCRTEHMFFETSRLPIVQRMIVAQAASERSEAIQELLPLQREDFAGLFRAMAGHPVVIRLLDPPLHEFLPDYDELIQDLADLKVQIQHHRSMGEIDQALEEIRTKQDFLERVEALRESNPMLGTRGVRLGIQIPELTRMQARAVFEAACQVSREGIEIEPEIMIPLTHHVRELELQKETISDEAAKVMEEQGLEIPYRFGTMIEIPRAALTADELAEHAEFFSFGTNDLTQTTCGISRDDSERGFLMHYIRNEILETNPFATIDEKGVGQLIGIAAEKGRATRPDLELGICGEHGGDPDSIDLCHRLGLDYVSCSPFRVPIARLAAATPHSRTPRRRSPTSPRRAREDARESRATRPESPVESGRPDRALRPAAQCARTRTMRTRPGRPEPLGATWDGAGTNFALASEHATAVELCLFERGEERERILLSDRTGSVWHTWVEDVGPGQHYGYRVHGPYSPGEGHRFNPAKLVIDPCTHAVSGGIEWRPELRGGADPSGLGPEPDPRDSAPFVPRGVVVDVAFDWQGDRPPAIPWADTVLYECHVRGATQRHPAVADTARGRYRGLASPPMVDHLRELGVTAVQLMPVQHFVTEQRLERLGLVNYWGYNPLVFSAPTSLYASGDTGAQVAEFQEMVRDLHAAGLEVILDVVYNHTAEAGADGPTLSLRGIDNAAYYRLDPEDPRRYVETTGLRERASGLVPTREAPAAGQPALVGPRDARRRVPLRPRPGDGAQRLRRARPRVPVRGDPPRPGAPRREVDRRALGHLARGTLPWSVPGRLRGMEL